MDSIKIKGDEVWFGGYLAARLLESAPPTILDNFTTLLEGAEEPASSETLKQLEDAKEDINILEEQAGKALSLAEQILTVLDQ